MEVGGKTTLKNLESMTAQKVPEGKIGQKNPKGMIQQKSLITKVSFESNIAVRNLRA